jgi:hypothetical protein
MVTPKIDASSTGRRPNRSESALRIGRANSEISAQTAANQPMYRAAVPASPPTRSWISRGRTGMTTPNATMSMTRTTPTRRAAAGGGVARAVSDVAVIERRPLPLLAQRRR